jgi:hypothetical protein
MSVSKMKKRKLEAEGRVFQQKWENVIFFSVVRDKIVCIICNKGVSAPKEHNFRRHYETLHKDKFGVPEGKLREDKLKDLKSDMQRQQNIFTVAKKSKPFTDGEYVCERMYNEGSRNTLPRKTAAF